MPQDNGWNEWSRHVLAELIRLNDCYEELNKNLGKIQVDIGMLQVKAGMWGAVGGILTAACLLFIKYLEGK